MSSGRVIVLASTRHSRQSARVSAVEHERCEACGFDGSVYDDVSLVASIDDLRSRWRRLLSEAGSELRIRPHPSTWSAIEYAAHSRDITALHVFGVEQALTEDEPIYPAIDGDALIEASAATYGEEDLDTVVDQLDLEVRRLRDVAANAAGDAWERGITVGDSRSTIRRLLEHALHDSLHHLDDVQRGLVTIRGRNVAP
jgi:DinB superfamily